MKQRLIYLMWVAIFVFLSSHTWLTENSSALGNDRPIYRTNNVFYVSPNGSPSGDGSQQNPWDLATALAHPPPVQPGDTIWMRGGTYSGIYTSYLTGTVGNPITLRAYPGELVQIDTRAADSAGENFIIYGSYTHYWGFELTNSRTSNRSHAGFAFLGNSTGNKFINLIIHDLGNNSLRDGNELYGCLLYNNGVDGSGLEHQLYIQNADPNHPVKVVDSMIFNGFAFGIHAYSSGAGFLNGIYLTGNTWFNNGVAQTNGELKDNVLVAGISNCPENISLEGNMGWASSASTRSVSFGRYCSTTNKDITLTGNYLVGSTRFYNTWQSVDMQGNTFYSYDPLSSIDSVNYPNNNYLDTQPTQNKVVIQSNQYEPDRAHITVYNWGLDDSVEVDLSSILSPGDIYQIHNAQNYFGPLVKTGIYTGEALTLPMNGLTPAQPTGPGLIETSEYTGAAFNVFVLTKTGNCPNCLDSVYLPFIKN